MAQLIRLHTDDLNSSATIVNLDTVIKIVARHRTNTDHTGGEVFGSEIYTMGRKGETIHTFCVVETPEQIERMVQVAT